MSKSGAYLTKDADGGYNLFGFFSNRWRDQDFHSAPEHGGEIVSRAAHAEYAKWLDKNPQHAPELWTWHVPGTARKSRADWWDWTGDFFMANWPLTAEEHKAISDWAKEEVLGMSFGFYVFQYDEKEGAIDRYRAFEASVLPLDAAANAWTRIELVADPGVAAEVKEQDKMAMSQRKRAALVKMYGEEFVATREALDAEIAAELDAAGYDSKELDDDDAATTEVVGASSVEVTPEAEVATEAAVLTALKALETVITADLKALATTVDDLAQRLAIIEQAEADERKAAAMPPSLLAAYAPGRSILDRGEQENPAVISGRSALARKAPAAPAAKSANSPIAVLLGDIQQ